MNRLAIADRLAWIAALLAGVGLLRGARVAGAFALPMLIWLFLTSAGIVGGFAFAALAGDDVPLVVAGVVGGVGIAAFLPAAVAVVRAGARDGASLPATKRWESIDGPSGGCGPRRICSSPEDVVPARRSRARDWLHPGLDSAALFAWGDIGEEDGAS